MPERFNFRQALVVDVSDIHANSVIAPCVRGYIKDNGDSIEPSRQQRWLNSVWSQFWEYCDDRKRELDWPTFVILNGELADDNKHATTELMSKNPADQLGMAIELLDPALQVADYVIVIKGTEAHSGPQSWMDEQIARMLTKEDDFELVPANKSENRYSHWEWRGRLGGVLFDVAHHPGHGHMREWTRGGDANRLAADIVMRYARYNKGVIKQGDADKQIETPDLVLRGHNHKPSDSANNHVVRAIISPGWQLRGAFGYRLGGAWLPIGGNLIECDRGRYMIDQKEWYWPLEQYWTPGVDNVH